jgi:hypothetical protein
MATGENAGTWGQITNTNLYLLQQAIGGYEEISIAGGAQTTALTMSNGAISNARNAVIKLTGTITGNQVVTIPTGIEKTYIVANGTVGVFTVEFKQAGGTGVTFATTDKSTKILFADGTNIVDTGTVSETGIQTLTNKTLTSPIINTAPSPTFTTAITLNATGELRLADTDSSNYVGFKSPGTVSTNKIWTLPSADGTSGQALVTNGSATLSFADAGRTGAVNWDTTPKTTTVTAASGVGYFVDTTSGAITVNLPAGVAGSIVAVSDYANTAATNNITIDPNGTDKINGVAGNAIISTNGAAITLIYIDSTRGWKDINDATLNVTATSPFVAATGGTITTSGDFKIHTFTGPGTFTVTNAGAPTGSNSVEYLVVAGGGGGSSQHSGGGGAGGYRTVFPSPATAGFPVTAQAYPITVGSGGAGGPASPSQDGTSGNNSVFSTITSTGGGGGGSFPDRGGKTGGSGGGGGSNSASGGAGNTPPTSPSQGNTGGNGATHDTGGGGGGGGGGSSATGQNAVAGPSGKSGNGGAGTQNNICGSSYYWAGGGGGGIIDTQTSNAPAGVGGIGGGGGGANKRNSAGGTGGGSAINSGGNGGTQPGPTPGGPAVGGAGGANSGGGGGGGGSDGDAGGAGGSGIVVIRYKFQ